MDINPPAKARAIIYAVNALATPFVAYLLARGVIGELEVALWAGEMTAVFALAGLNVSTK